MIGPSPAGPGHWKKALREGAEKKKVHYSQGFSAVSRAEETEGVTGTRGRGKASGALSRVKGEDAKRSVGASSAEEKLL